MAMTLVYRIQDAQGLGPYQPFHDAGLIDYEASANLYPWSNREHDDSPHTPDPRNDFDGFYRIIKTRHKFGFPSLEALHAWFTNDELQALAEWGFTIHVIQAYEVIVSDSGKQCIFLTEET